MFKEQYPILQVNTNSTADGGNPANSYEILNGFLIHVLKLSGVSSSNKFLRQLYLHYSIAVSGSVDRW